MARKDTEKKLQALLEREKKLKEEMKEAKKQMQKEEREERKHCYLEIGKIVESCIDRNFREEDIDTFSKFATENEDLILSYFKNVETEDDSDDSPVQESLSDEEEVFEEVEYEEEGQPEEKLPFGG